MARKKDPRTRGTANREHSRSFSEPVQQTIKSLVSASLSTVDECLHNGKSYGDFSDKDTIQLNYAFSYGTIHMALGSRDTMLCRYDSLHQQGNEIARRLVNIYRLQNNPNLFMCVVSFRSIYIFVASLAGLCLREVQLGNILLNPQDERRLRLTDYRLSMFVAEARLKLGNVNDPPIPLEDVYIDNTTTVIEAPISFH